MGPAVAGRGGAPEPVRPPGRASPAVATAAPVSTLRGASVAADPARVGRVLGAAFAVGLTVLVVVLVVAGVHRNAQASRLRRDGVRVTVTVSGCVGLLGGSGSNVAGYQCSGSFLLDGRRYHEPIPGRAFYRPGTAIPAVAVPGDPSLLSPAGAVGAERASTAVFVAPAVLAGVLLAFVGLVWWRRRSRRSGGRGDVATGSPGRAP